MTADIAEPPEQPILLKEPDFPRIASRYLDRCQVKQVGFGRAARTGGAAFHTGQQAVAGREKRVSDVVFPG